MIARLLVVPIFSLIIVSHLAQCGDDSAATDENYVAKRTRNPYSWMNDLKRNAGGLFGWSQDNDNAEDFDVDELAKRARNPYSWLNHKGKRAVRNPYSWMAYDEKRAPRNPYSWMYTLQKRFPSSAYVRNPYSWQNLPSSW